MRIGVDIRCLMESRYSGISEYTHNLLINLFKIDSKNQYFLFCNSYKPTKNPEFNFPNVYLKSFRYPNKIFNLTNHFLKINPLDKMAGGVDVFLSPSFMFSYLSPACKKIIVVHDLSFKLYPEFFTFKKRLWHKLIRPKNICQKADKIVAVSQNTKNDLIKIYNIPAEKIEVIYQGISQIFFEPINNYDRIKTKYHLPDNYVLSLGNLEPRKNIGALIAAFGKLNDPNLWLLIAGSPSWKYKSIYRLCQSSPAKNRIKFLGYVDATDKPALYALAKVFVYPSIYEGFGLPVAEAMACGTPVITSFNSSLPEVVGNSGLMIDPNNINDIAQAIKMITSDENLWQKLSKLGQEQKSRFNWTKRAQEILALINSFQP